jgi:hypothetical protein
MTGCILKKINEVTRKHHIIDAGHAHKKMGFILGYGIMRQFPAGIKHQQLALQNLNLSRCHHDWLEKEEEQIEGTRAGTTC